MLRQTISLQIFKRLFSLYFTWSILEYLDLFDVESFFTLVSSLKTTDIILDRIHNKNLITKIRRKTLNKLLKHYFTKNSFTLNGIMYEKINDVSMESFFRTLANIIMTELKVGLLTNFSNIVLKLYIRYVS